LSGAEPYALGLAPTALFVCLNFYTRYSNLMEQGFWKNLKKPVMVLAPMADVTDAAFRRVIAKYGKPDALWTEFVSADGLFLSPVKDYCEAFIKGEITREELFSTISKGIGGAHLLLDLLYTEEERPIVAQFFTSKPERMKKAAELASALKFDGIDINMGCPDGSVNKQGAGAALIKDPELAREIIRAAKEGAGGIPVSVKTRAGYNREELETWAPALLEEEPAVLTMHARIRKDMSKVPARWTLVKRTAEIRNEMGKGTLVFGNGDALDLPDAEKKAEESGADGVMLGRAIFGNPWLFNSEIESGSISVEEKLRVMVEHTKLFEELLGEYKNFAIMKKHYKAYVNGWDGAKELRMKLMEAKDAAEVEKMVGEYLTATVSH
jgi:tRNA-dihydrouridine synthase